jgi:hypothetical protein
LEARLFAVSSLEFASGTFTSPYNGLVSFPAQFPERSATWTRHPHPRSDRFANDTTAHLNSSFVGIEVKLHPAFALRRPCRALVLVCRRSRQAAANATGADLLTWRAKAD